MPFALMAVPKPVCQHVTLAPQRFKYFSPKAGEFFQHRRFQPVVINKPLDKVDCNEKAIPRIQWFGNDSSCPNVNIY
jgi:hypothetical protein